MAELFIKIKTAFDGAGFKKASGSVNKFLGGALKVGALGAAAGIAAVGSAAVAVTVKAVDFAGETTAAMDLVAARTGATGKELEDFKDIALDVFAQNWGSSIEDVALAMAEVNTITKLEGKELEKTTAKALALEERFDKGINESVDATNSLMENFGLTSDQAFDFLTKGLQGGLDSSGDFLDSIAEYSNQFSNAGFDAGQFFSIMETGSQSGVLGTDKISDAVKEMTVRLNEGGADVGEAFTSIGLDFDKISGSVAAGDETWADYFQNIVGGLNGIEDPIARSQAQAAIFGTMAEDLGVGFTEGLNAATTSIEDMAGATETATKDGQDLGTAWEGAMRQLMVSLEPAAQELLPLLVEGVGKFGEFITAAQPVFSEFAGNLKETLGPAIEIIGKNLARIGEVFGFVQEGATGMDSALAILEGTLNLVVIGIKAVAVVSEILANAFELAKGLGQQIGQITNLVGGKIASGGIGGLLGFQHGGSFTVGGSGGPDSQVVAFRATPGEGVTVGGAGGGGQSVIVNINVAGSINGIEELNAMFQSLVDQIAEAMA